MANLLNLLKTDWENATAAIQDIDPILREKLAECDNANFKIYANYFTKMVTEELDRRGL